MYQPQITLMCMCAYQYESTAGADASVEVSKVHNIKLLKSICAKFDLHNFVILY